MIVTGAGGMLGSDLVPALEGAGHAVSGFARSGLDITRPADVRSALGGADVVVNCAAWTDVDGAEEHEADATRVNGDGPRVLAQACAETGARLVQVSTDYVFDGTARTPYAEDHPLAPASAYGRSKAAGERAVRELLPEDHLVVRTAWLYGAHGGCFPRTIARAAASRPTLTVVDDQTGQPTWTADVADLVVRLLDSSAPAGTYHATASGEATWFDFAGRVVGPDRVQPMSSADLDRPAPRPAYSVLGHAALERVGVAPIGDWRERWDLAAGQVLAGVEPGG